MPLICQAIFRAVYYTLHNTFPFLRFCLDENRVTRAYAEHMLTSCQHQPLPSSSGGRRRKVSIDWECIGHMLTIC